MPSKFDALNRTFGPDNPQSTRPAAGIVPVTGADGKLAAGFIPAGLDAGTLDGYDSATFLLKAGGTMTGAITLSGAEATGAQAASRAYAESLAVAGALPWITTGVRFLYQNSTTVYLSPNGLDGKARIPAWNGATRKTFEVSSAGLYCSLGTSGPGGLDASAVAANTGYEVRLIGKEDGTAALIATVNGNSLTAQSGYTYTSAVIAFMSYTGSSAIRDFEHRGDRWFYHYADGTTPRLGIAMLSAGTATSATAIDCSDYVPTGAVGVLCHAVALHDSTTVQTCTISDADSTERATFRVQRPGTLYTGGPHQQIYLPLNGNPAADITYAWTGTPATGLTLGLIAFDLPKMGV